MLLVDRATGTVPRDDKYGGKQPTVTNAVINCFFDLVSKQRTTSIQKLLKLVTKLAIKDSDLIQDYENIMNLKPITCCVKTWIYRKAT